MEGSRHVTRFLVSRSHPSQSVNVTDFLVYSHVRNGHTSPSVVPTSYVPMNGRNAATADHSDILLNFGESACQLISTLRS